MGEQKELIKALFSTNERA